ncbi:biliverdin-producing heme oxygenase [Sphingomonas sp.]|uniref:biliverdin-producing heme oxygenase n=1 Tax=Sphingomonas sp. TaxID=28214 RepID=UPI00286CE367|nr:biliverdin-producing heme oxygenase [Sphingomonas sp.]
MTAREELKAATQAAHDRVDAAFDHDLANPIIYVAFLAAQASAYLPVEEALTACGAARLIENWHDHRRAPLLAADLATLDCAPPDLIAPPEYRGEAAVVGGLYVLEGSRMGAAVLLRRVLPGLPIAFLSARAEPGHWTRFIASLDQLLYSPQRLDAAIEAASATFACFEQAAKLVVKR